MDTDSTEVSHLTFKLPSLSKTGRLLAKSCIQRLRILSYSCSSRDAPSASVLPVTLFRVLQLFPAFQALTSCFRRRAPACQRNQQPSMMRSGSAVGCRCRFDARCVFWATAKAEVWALGRRVRHVPRRPLLYTCCFRFQSGTHTDRHHAKVQRRLNHMQNTLCLTVISLMAGVVLLELLTGRSAVSKQGASQHKSLAREVGNKAPGGHSYVRRKPFLLASLCLKQLDVD